MSDYEYRPKKRRKKRKQVGSEISEKAELGIKELLAGRDVGLLCSACRKRAPWKDLEATYHVESDRFVRTWFHKSCGSMVREEWMT